MPTTVKGKPKAPLQSRIIDAAILIISLMLGASVFLTLQDPLFNFGAIWVVQNIEGAVHQAYNMSANTRNFILVENKLPNREDLSKLIACHPIPGAHFWADVVFESFRNLGVDPTQMKCH